MQAAQQNSGFTLIELMVTVAVLAILLGIGIPSFQGTLDKRRLVGAAEQIYADLQYARSEAIKQNKLVTISFRKLGTNTAWCYGIDDSPSTVCDCTATATNCTVGTAPNSVEKVANNIGFRGVDLTDTTFTSNNMCIDPRRGTVSSGTISGSSCSSNNSGRASFNSSTGSLDVIVSQFGRVKLCAPTSADRDKTGYPRC